MALLSETEADRRLCYLTTSGRVTGRPHEVEIWFGVEGDTVYILSGGRDRSDWVRNIRQSPACSVRVDDAVYQGEGRILADDDPLDERARRVVATKYGEVSASGELSEWGRTSLAVAIALNGRGDGA